MKTLATFITATALATASAAVNAEDVQPMPVFNPYNPFAMTEAQQTTLIAQHKKIAEQHQAFAEQQATAMRNAIEAQRKFAEQMSVVPMAPTQFTAPVAPVTRFAMPEAPAFPKPFELSELPAAPSIAGLDPESRRTEMRKYMEERRATLRKRMQEQRDAAMQERDKYLEQMGRIRPEV